MAESNDHLRNRRYVGTEARPSTRCKPKGYDTSLRSL